MSHTAPLERRIRFLSPKVNEPRVYLFIKTEGQKQFLQAVQTTITASKYVQFTDTTTPKAVVALE